MIVRLISRPDMGAVTLCEHAAAMCTNSHKPAQALRGAVQSGHDSVLEHASFTFEIDGISRVTLAQLTRHRIASFSVLSQRYVDMTDVPVVVPDSIRENPELRGAFDNVACQTMLLYQKLTEAGIPKEDARYILPEGTQTSLIMTMNARELGHFFTLRCCNRAQWEIREMADQMLRILRAEYPEIFRNAGPSCIRNGCHEKRPCGRPRKGSDWDACDSDGTP